MLQKHKIKFVVCDMPEATPLNIHIMGAIAQYERETISKRTSRALQELKKQGKKLGSHNPKVKRGLKKLWKERRKKRAEIKKLAKKNPIKKHEKIKTQREIFDKSVLSTIRILRKDVIAIEVKLKKEVSAQDFKGLKAIQELPNVKKRIVIYLGIKNLPRKTKEGIEIWPFDLFLKNLQDGNL